MGSILDRDSTVHHCPCRGQRGQETGSVILRRVSKSQKSEGTGRGIRWYFASIAAGKQGQTCQCVSNAVLTELDHLNLCTTRLKKIHHVGKPNTPMLQTSSQNSARPVHVTWPKKNMVTIYGLFVFGFVRGVSLSNNTTFFIQTVASSPAFAWPRSLGVPQVLSPRHDQVVQHAHPQPGTLLFYKRWGFDAKW